MGDVKQRSNKCQTKVNSLNLIFAKESIDIRWDIWNNHWSLVTRSVKLFNFFKRKWGKAICRVQSYCKESKLKFFIQVHQNISPILLEKVIKSDDKINHLLVHFVPSIIETMKLLVSYHTEMWWPYPLSRKELLPPAQYCPGIIKPPCKRSCPSWDTLPEQGGGTKTCPFQPIAEHSEELFAPNFLNRLAKVLLGYPCGLTASLSSSCFLSFPFTLINILYPKLLNIFFQRIQLMAIRVGRISEVPIRACTQLL